MDLATLLVYAFVAFTFFFAVYVVLAVVAEFFYITDYIRQMRKKSRKGGE